MSAPLEAIAEWLGVTQEEARQQMIDGAYANGKMANDDITREMVEKAFEEFEDRL
jgi:hypothetical protein